MSGLMQQYVSGLKSRNDEARSKTARDLNHYVTTELREVSMDDLTTFMDEFNHQIFEMVSSSDVNEKKGGILAIGQFRRSFFLSSI
jgi:FKBP12-rapamycin complex-associated protein